MLYFRRRKPGLASTRKQRFLLLEKSFLLQVWTSKNGRFGLVNSGARLISVLLITSTDLTDFKYNKACIQFKQQQTRFFQNCTKYSRTDYCKSSLEIGEKSSYRPMCMFFAVDYVHIFRRFPWFFEFYVQTDENDSNTRRMDANFC